MTFRLTTSLWLAGALLWPALALAAQTVDERQAVPENAEVSIKVQRGRVNISSWDKSEIQVKGTLDELTEGLRFVVDGNQVVIEDTMPRSYTGKGDGSSLTIWLPAATNINGEGISSDYRISGINAWVSLQNVSGDMLLEDITGPLRVKTISGDITAQRISQTMELASVSGEIQISKSDGDLALANVSGNMVINTNASAVKLETVSGEVELAAPQLSQLKLNSVSGDVQAHVGGALTEAKLDSVSGDIQLIVSQLPNARFVINGGPGGKVVNQLSDDKPQKDKYSRQQSLIFNSGSGNGTVVINTISGTLTLAK
ncbi:DUF4097 family beta strand repeat-containing protein [Shewanella sp. GXUN23E]|uniref:DUF4097 family beta strand repeat-containing protein n=1 Tax=Shewanella sp. GXUN23E TaxID=3422498 RepID=UPI003D7D6575